MRCCFYDFHPCFVFVAVAAAVTVPLVCILGVPALIKRALGAALQLCVASPPPQGSLGAWVQRAEHHRLSMARAALQRWRAAEAAGGP